MGSGCAAVAVVGMLAITACTGDGDAAPTTTAPTTAPTTATTTNEAPATTAAPAPTQPESTTTEPAPTTAATTAPPTTVTTPTTAALDPIADLAAAIQRDAQAGEDLIVAVLADPSAPDATNRLSTRFDGVALENVTATLEQFRRDDLVAQPNPEVPSQLVITSVPELIAGSDPPRARAETCRLDSALVLAPLNDTDARVVVDDKIYRTNATSTFVLVDGIWKLEGGDLISESEGDRSCA